MKELKKEAYDYLKNVVGLHNSYNVEVSFLWYVVALNNKFEDILEHVVNLLENAGRMKFVKPLYQALKNFDSNKAVEVFAKLRNLYHPVAVRLLDKIIYGK